MPQVLALPQSSSQRLLSRPPKEKEQKADASSMCARAAASRWGPRPQPPLPAPTPCSAQNGQMIGTQPRGMAFRPQKRQAPPHAGPWWTCSEAYTERYKRAHADGISRLIHSSVGSDCRGLPDCGWLCSSREKGRGAFLRPGEGILCPRQGFCSAWGLGKEKCWALMGHPLGGNVKGKSGAHQGIRSKSRVGQGVGSWSGSGQRQ